MPGADENETGLTPGQQVLLMGQVAALEQALLLVVRQLSRDQRETLHEMTSFARDNHQATATIPAQYRAAFDAAMFRTFDRLTEELKPDL